MSENERQSQTNAVTNNKLQGTVVTYLRCDGIVNNKIKKGLLLSLPVKKIKSVTICRALSSTLAVWWPGAQNARDPPFL